MIMEAVVQVGASGQCKEGKPDAAAAPPGHEQLQIPAAAAMVRFPSFGFSLDAVACSASQCTLLLL